MGEPTDKASSLAAASTDLDIALENLLKSTNNLTDLTTTSISATSNLSGLNVSNSIGANGAVLTGVATSSGPVWSANPNVTTGYVQFNNAVEDKWQSDTLDATMYVRCQNDGDFGGKISLFINNREVLILDHRGKITINSEEPMEELVKKFTDCLGTNWEEWLNKSVDLWSVNEAAIKARRAAFEEALEICTNEEERTKIQKKLSETII